MRLTTFLSSSSVPVSVFGLSLGLLVALSGVAACSSSNDVTVDAADGGKKPSKQGDDDDTADDDDDDVPPTGDGGSKEGGDPPSGTITSTALKNGPAQLLGITTGVVPHVVYLAVVDKTLSLEVVPTAGGAAEVLASLGAADGFGVAGGVVYWITNIDQDGNGDLNFWTKTSGPKLKVTKTAFRSMIRGSEDGSRIAFPVNANGTDTFELAVTSTANPLATPVLAGTTDINVPSQECYPDIGFAGNTLLAAYCTSKTPNTPQSMAARLYAVDVGGVARRLDGKGATAANGVRLGSSWYADKTGSKVFFIGPGNDAPGKLVDVATANVTALENGVLGGFMLSDGSGAVYATATTIKKAGTAGAPTTLATVPVKFLITLGTNDKRVFFSSQTGANGLADLRTIDTTAASQTPVDLVATPTALFSGILAQGESVMYRTGVDGTGKGTLNAKPAAGGNEVVLAQNCYGGLGVPSTAGVLAATDLATSQNKVTTVKLHYVDGVAGGALVPVTEDALANAWGFSAKKFAYTRTGQNAGVFLADLP